MTSYKTAAMRLADEDMVFAIIYGAPNPLDTLRKLAVRKWDELTSHFVTHDWVRAALYAKKGIYKSPTAFTQSPDGIEEIKEVQSYYRKFNEYASLLSSTGEKPLSDYLNGISVEDFRTTLLPLRGMDAARAIQKMYESGTLDSDLGGTQLHRYMEQLELPYIPTVSHLNSAKRNEITEARYNMTKSRDKNEKFLK